MNIYDLIDKYSWTNNCLYLENKLIAIGSKTNGISINIEFFDFFKPTNMTMDVCKITSTVRINGLYGFVHSNGMAIIDNRDMYLMGFKLITKNVKKFARVETIARKHWEALERVSYLYGKAIPPSTSNDEIHKLVAGKAYCPITVLGRIGVTGDLEQRVTFMKRHRKALILQLVYCAKNTIKTESVLISRHQPLLFEPRG